MVKTKSKKKEENKHKDQGKVFFKLGFFFSALYLALILFFNHILNILVLANLYSVSFSYPIIKTIAFSNLGFTFLIIMMFLLAFIFNLPTIDDLKKKPDNKKVKKKNYDART